MKQMWSPHRVTRFPLQTMFNVAWLREQNDLGIFTLRVFLASISKSKNLSNELRMRRRKSFLCMLIFFAFLGLEMITIAAMRRLGVTY
jgi:hypothetical protein